MVMLRVRLAKYALASAWAMMVIATTGIVLAIIAHNPSDTIIMALIAIVSATLRHVPVSVLHSIDLSKNDLQTLQIHYNP